MTAQSRTSGEGLLTGKMRCVPRQDHPLARLTVVVSRQPDSQLQKQLAVWMAAANNQRIYIYFGHLHAHAYIHTFGYERTVRYL